MSLRPLAGILLLALVAGCAQPPLAPADDGPATSEPVERQTFQGDILASTHVGCLVGMPAQTDGITHTAIPVDERSKGQPFVAYINATEADQVLEARVQFLFPNDPDPVGHSYSAPLGRAIRGTVPEVDVPVTAYFDVCGSARGISVTYNARLAAS